MMLIRHLSLDGLLLYSSVALHWLTRVSGAPELSFPVNSQVPPVARANKPFQFTFAPSTFTGNASSLQYELSNAPFWIQLDNTSRRLAGTPDGGHLGPLTFNLVASDSSGSTTDSVTLVVSDNEGPGLGLPTSQQLASSGSTSGSDTLLFYPASPLSISFAWDTFTNTNAATNYYAICANNTPLPSWIVFDTSNLSFSGTTPSFDSPNELPQELDIRLTASDVAGFSAAMVTFHITIALHELTFGSMPIIINMTSERPIVFNGLQSALKLDGQVVHPSELNSIKLEGPKWLSIDTTTLIILGTPTADAESQDVAITAKDLYGNVANTTAYLATGAQSDLLVGRVDPLQAAIGKKFTYIFSKDIFPSPNVSIGIDLGNTSSWLQFDRDSFTLSGVVPANLYPQTDFLNLTATQGSRSSYIPINLELIPANSSLLNPSTTSSLMPSSTVDSGNSGSPATSTTAGSPISGTNANGQKSLAAAILLPIVGVLALLLCIWWLKKRSKSKTAGRHNCSFISCVRKSRSQRPRYTIGEPQPLEQSLARSRPSSQRWSLPRVDLNIDLFRPSTERRRSSQLLPSYRAPHLRNASGQHETIEELLLEDVPTLQRENSCPCTQRSISRMASTRPSKKHTQRTLNTYHLAGKTNARGSHGSGRTRVPGLGHGIGTPLPSVLYRRPGHQRLSILDLSRVDTGVGGISLYNQDGSIRGRGGLFDGRTTPHQPCNALNTYYRDRVESNDLKSLTREAGKANDQSTPTLRNTRANSTIRLVGSSPPPFTSLPELARGDTSPMTKRNNYLKERHATRGSGSVLSARSLKRCSMLAYDLSAGTRRSEFGFSSVPRGGLSAQRKGEMMQRGTHSSFADSIRIPVNRYRSPCLVESDSRYEDPEDSDTSSWEDDQPESDDRTWQTTEGGSSLAFPWYLHAFH